MRVCFSDINVTLPTARRMREQLIVQLQKDWEAEPKDGWASAIEATERSGQMADSTADLWESIVDERAYLKGASHRLVYCDAIQGEFALPERRPLVPHALINVTAPTETRSGSRAAITPVEVPGDKNETNWARIGSTWTPARSATPFWNHQGMSGGAAQASISNPQRPQATGANSQKTVAIKQDDAWDMYYDNEGSPYYHQQSTNTTVWDLPTGAVLRTPTGDGIPTSGANQNSRQASNVDAHQRKTPVSAARDAQWKAYKTNEGDTYYHNPVTQETVWELPAGAALMP